ncbi:hypothetical protein HBI24_231420 [Parastagonospora nodorum]|nr:hypothetical protein HBI95_214510 [Parastagonospora nodorum]KAH4596524.1 hypothetical protein HBH82_227360 [Parastagonospora nodorum]KAH4662434.1 hypothetical protein HBH78_217890 [Parastagonospora nodorum]KAH4693198.1 hypothetical protein HBH67_224610 [Parastagonospora nodorum]KAH4757758.1 hypothetical protein HBH63_224820 [Parastagonospora nodorum]
MVNQYTLRTASPSTRFPYYGHDNVRKSRIHDNSTVFTIRATYDNLPDFRTKVVEQLNQAESRKTRSNDGSIFRWKLVRVQNKTQKARKAFDFAAATYHYVIVLNTPPQHCNVVSVGNASIGKIQTGNAPSTAIGNTAIVRRTAPRVTRASEKRKEQYDHRPRRNRKWVRHREVADSYDKDKNPELRTEVPSPKPTTSRNKVIAINPPPVAEDSSTFKGPIAYRFRCLPHVLPFVMDNENGDGITITMNIEGAGRGMKIRVDSTSVTVTASNLLIFGFPTTTSASSTKCSNAKNNLKAQDSSRNMSRDNREKYELTILRFTIQLIHQAPVKFLPAFS